MAQDHQLYREPYRPQFHFSPPCRWMNDPNGMVFYDGEYHLFYQFYPNSTVQGPKHWGHAVSADLVHWENLPIALYPDDIGPIWSGSAVVDADNTSGLVPGGGLVAIFTYENQSQGIAYSTDRGRTWTMYDGNPVIPAVARDFRDPKVFWYAPTKQWIMVLAAGKQAQFYGSPNLKTWEYLGSFSGGHTMGVWEVPDVFPLQVEGTTRWVLLVSVSTLAPAGGSGIQYFIADFDGRTFTTDQTEVLWLDYGPDNYAGTTWSDTPDGRRIYIGWLNNWLYAEQVPTSVWRGAATLPRELQLQRTPQGVRLVQAVPKAFEALRTPLGSWKDLAVGAPMPLDGVRGRLLEIEVEFELGTAERFGLEVHRSADSGAKARIVYNRSRGQLLISRGDAKSATRETVQLGGFNPVFGAPVEPTDNRLRLHIFVDESSIEIFAQDGQVVMSSQIFVDPTSDGVALFAEGGNVTVSHMDIYALRSIWPSPEAASAQISSFNYCR